MNFKINNYFNDLIKKAYDSAKSTLAKSILFIVAFVEAIFFPIPVDPLLAFLVLSDKKKYLKLTIICTFGSVIGGLIGWLIGYFIGPTIENYFIKIPFISEDTFNKVKKGHDDYGSLIIFLGAFTPLPFKIISITSGIFKVNLLSFILMSIIGRGLRFFLISIFVKIYGNRIIQLLQKKIFLITTILGVIILIIISLV